MYVARFCYDFAPVDRDRALDIIRHELKVARGLGFQARLLIPLTRPPGGPSLQFEVTVPRLDDIETLRHGGRRDPDEQSEWAHDLSEILVQPPNVEILRVAATESGVRKGDD